MTFDLGAALRKKEERESARLADFLFRCRVRALRLLLRSLGWDEGGASQLAAAFGEDAALAHLANETGIALDRLRADYRRCRNEARLQSIAERGDPAAHPLA